jgi:hypothetical protein
MSHPTQPGNETPEAVARAFYEALAAKDPETIGTLVDRWFHEDAALEVPRSLPYGGRVESARRLRRMFTAMAGGEAPVGPAGLTVASVVGGVDSAAVQLEFGWRPPGGGEEIPSGALELWTFVDGRVREIRAYYWDTAALVGAADGAAPVRGPRPSRR